MSDMKCLIKCPMCGEMLQKYGEIDPNTGTSIVLGANCPKCGIGNSDIKLWQELIRTRKALEIAVDGLEKMTWGCDSTDAEHLLKEIKEIIAQDALKQITAQEQKDVK